MTLLLSQAAAGQAADLRRASEQRDTSGRTDYECVEHQKTCAIVQPRSSADDALDERCVDALR
jgi:hypothetical protein